IPAITGSEGPISSYWGAIQFLSRAPDVIQEGYLKYRNGAFRVPTLFRWTYVVNGTQHITEVASAPEHVLSAVEGIEDVCQLRTSTCGFD
ncbi:hypothetical protein B0H13DRAFT_1619833, partial [Mycena leptocephala]